MKLLKDDVRKMSTQELFRALEDACFACAKKKATKDDKRNLVVVEAECERRYGFEFGR